MFENTKMFLGTSESGGLICPNVRSEKKIGGEKKSGIPYFQVSSKKTGPYFL